MRILTCMIAFVMSFQIMSAQKKYEISSSGCSVIMFCQPGFRTEIDAESNPYYTGRCAKDDLSYGVLCIKLAKIPPTLGAAESTMIEYIEYLKAEFEIIAVKGYKRGLRLRDRADTRGVTDNWTDNKNNYWKLKAFTDGKFIAILYVFSKNELLDTNEKMNGFFDSFAFPGME